MPLGGPGSFEYAVIEIHYDNPSLVAGNVQQYMISILTNGYNSLTTGVEDSSGLEFYYTTTEPLHEAGLLPVGHRVTPGMIIPPNTDNYVTEGLCSGQCTEQVSEHVYNILESILHIMLVLFCIPCSFSHQMESQYLQIYCIPTYMVTLYYS